MSPLVAPSPVSNARAYDEAAHASGELRAHWHDMLGRLRALGSNELGRRWEQAQALLEENGVTYNVYGDPLGIERPWQLNAVPLVLAADEWSTIETAITQRARVLSALLDDLYGPQRVLKEGWLPAELVLSNPGFLRACTATVPRGRGLVMYGADLARSHDGKWRVLADRTQAPSGSGYALENRVVIAKALPELFDGRRARRLAPYFQSLRDGLIDLAPDPNDNPLVVVLTPGPFNETYFEHAYLARYLGFPLVEGADLTARGERIYLKTLSGLRRVQVILRRQDDHFCDPLELYRDSRLGVAGLLQAIRAGNVVMANALGSGLLETPALMAFLPRVARELCGEELTMPSVRSDWCGDESARASVLGRLAELVLKPSFRGPASEVAFGAELSLEQRAVLARKIASNPAAFVAQEQIRLSTAPTEVTGDGAPRHVVLRVFAVATADGWSVMPGGLTRFASSRDGLVVSSQSGGGSKDTLVLADEPVQYVSLLGRVRQPLDVTRDSYALTSRVADNLFWLGRMSERLEAGVRRSRTDLRASLERAAHGDASDLEPGPPDLSGLRHDASELHRIGWLVRDRISMDAWRILLRISQELVERASTPGHRIASSPAVLDESVVMLSAFIGLVVDSTTRGLGWRFLELGRRIERALQVARLVRNGLSGALRPGARELQRVLDSADCGITYRARYHTHVQAPLVVDLLLLDEANPRSVAFQVAQIAGHLSVLEKVPQDSCLALLAALRITEVDELVEIEGHDRGSARARMLALLGEIEAALGGLSDALNHAYLSHALPERQPEAVWRRNAS